MPAAKPGRERKGTGHQFYPRLFMHCISSDPQTALLRRHNYYRHFINKEIESQKDEIIRCQGQDSNTGLSDSSAFKFLHLSEPINHAARRLTEPSSLRKSPHPTLRPSLGKGPGRHTPGADDSLLNHQNKQRLRRLSGPRRAPLGVGRDQSRMATQRHRRQGSGPAALSSLHPGPQ